METITRKDLDNCRIVTLCFDGLGRYPFDVEEINDFSLTAVENNAEGGKYACAGGFIKLATKKREAHLLYATGGSYRYNFEPDVYLGATLERGMFPEEVEIYDGKADTVFPISKDNFKIIFED